MAKRKRTFNSSEKNALWIAADGKCQNCGETLDRNWEADHIMPFSKGGDTDLVNGQALCQDCNRKKGANLMTWADSMIELREFQKRFIDTAMQKAQAGTKELICNVFAGSGKTLASQSAADKLMQLGIIEQVIVFVPRINLAQQYELDWKEMRGKLSWKTIMKDLNHTDNSFPLIYKDASGYITTYASLCANPQIHLREIKKKKTLLILDEAHQLGIDEKGEDSTQSARWVEEAGKSATMVFVMSGTPYRADQKPLLFAYPDYYGEADAFGKRPLQPDLEATYRDGVREGYLRRFQYELAEAGYTWVDLMGEEEERSIKKGEATVYTALKLKDVWQPLVDMFVDKLHEQKRLVNTNLCGLVAAGEQKQARKVKKYLNEKYPHLRVLIAVSNDGADAQKALREFKRGNHDILVTVSMAYIGYDHKPINTLLLLTHFRSTSYLTQLIARGLRMWKEIEPHMQACYVIAPDDPLMSKFVEHMRSESNAGYSELQEEKKRDKSDGDNMPETLSLGFARDGFVTDLRAMGIDPTGDLTSEEMQYAEQLRKAQGLPYPVTDLMMFARGLQQNKPNTNQIVARPLKTLKEQLEDARSILDTQVGTLAYKLNRENASKSIGEYKMFISQQLMSIYYVSVTKVNSVDDIRRRSKTVLRWTEQGYVDYVKD